MSGQDPPLNELNFSSGELLPCGLVIQELFYVGGLSRVWIAQCGGKKHILKSFRRDPEWGKAQTAESYHYFLNEGRWLPLLKHPGIASGRGTVAVNGHSVIVRDYVPGLDLRTWLDMHPSPRNLRTFSSIGLGLVGAVQYLHQAGLLHRDLAPWNILIDDSERTTIIDLQFMRSMAEHEETDPRRPTRRMTYGLGRWAYGAPELIDGLDDVYDHSADVYSLGAVLIELLVGRPPRRRAPSAFRSDLPPGLSELLWASVDELPANRPDLGEIRLALVAILSAEGSARD